MGNGTLNQAYLFIIFMLNGILIGLLFDLFRIWRRSFKTTDLITYIQDFVFWILVGIILLYSIFTFNNGEIRGYLFVGVLLGGALYLLTFSKYFIQINVKIVSFIKNILKQVITVILYPVKLLLSILRKVIFRPISFIFINIRRNMTDLTKKIKNSQKKLKKSNKLTKNMDEKKDFQV